MKLKFIIDEKYDKGFAKEQFFVKRANKKSSEDLLQYIDDQYKKTVPYLERTVKLYQNSWNEIDQNFSEYIERETNYKWFYPKYECVVSVIHRGISNWGRSPKIVRTWKENPYSMRRITAHELILSHYFEIHRHHYSDSGLTDYQIWALAEIAAFALTSLTSEVENFWPWDKEYYTNHNYPHIVDLQNTLKTVFLKKNHFDQYIDRGIEEVKKYPKMSLSGLE